MTLNWRDGGKAPFEMSRGAAVVDGGVAYFMDYNGQACSYNSTSKKWSELPKYPYRRYSSLAVVNGQLTAIGGCEDVRSPRSIHTQTNCSAYVEVGQMSSHPCQQSDVVQLQ